MGSFLYSLPHVHKHESVPSCSFEQRNLSHLVPCSSTSSQPSAANCYNALALTHIFLLRFKKEKKNIVYKNAIETSVIFSYKYQHDTLCLCDNKRP